MKGKFHLNEKIDDKMKRYCFISEITMPNFYMELLASNRKDKMLKEVESFILAVYSFTNLRFFAYVR